MKDLVLKQDMTYSEIRQMLKFEFKLDDDDSWLIDNNDIPLGSDCFNLPDYIRKRKSNGKNRLYIATKARALTPMLQEATEVCIIAIENWHEHCAY